MNMGISKIKLAWIGHQEIREKHMLTAHNKTSTNWFGGAVALCTVQH